MTRPELSSAIPAKAAGKVIDKNWADTFVFETFPECKHETTKQAIDCPDCVDKLYQRELWLEQLISNIDELVITDLDQKPIRNANKITVVRGRYDDCIGVVIE